MHPKNSSKQHGASLAVVNEAILVDPDPTPRDAEDPGSSRPSTLTLKCFTTQKVNTVHFPEAALFCFLLCIPIMAIIQYGKHTKYGNGYPSRMHIQCFFFYISVSSICNSPCKILVYFL